MNPKEQRAAAMAKAREIAEAAKGRAFTAEEREQVDAQLTEIDRLDAVIESAKADESRMARIGALAPAAQEGEKGGEVETPEGIQAKTVGDHFVKFAGGADGLYKLKTTRGFQVDTGEDGWEPDGTKAATDPNAIGTDLTAALTDVDRTIVQAYRRPVVSDLLGTGNITGTGVTYFVEGAIEGDFGMVAEGGQKPQLHMINPTPVTDRIKKIAGWWDDTEEMLEDAAWVASTFNNRARYRIELLEEAQLLRGDGTGNNILGMLNRSGIQEVEREGVVGTPAEWEPEQDAIFRALTAVETATGLSADGIIIHPLDYQRIRLSKDANGQYFGGGFFTGQYGNGGIAEKPPLWGTTTVVTPAASLGVAVVGAFKAATQVFRKGGLRVVVTNSDLGKFTKDILTTRMEKRVGLAVRVPSAIVEVLLADPA